MIEMELLGVQVELPSNSPLLLLREATGQGRVLPVVIDTPEAHAIHRGIEGIRLARPLTHDLLVQMLAEFEATIAKVVVTELRERTFFAEIELSLAGQSHTISARPSDAIALAVRTATPIYASEEVLAEAGQVLETHPTDDASDNDPDELLDEFKQFLDDVRPDDFQG
ncbi:MAG TPA: bifunctional nuclease family protein [Acidimicrobiales bacterium]|jgi:bifunctional DNase/RNase|nr:bifunctional nuclease family protein [Acidimicrobiales bacterium]|tara:strand:- start:327 stop:830 length:504 start_codon:yes stop_codon:yes gene_type:complete